MSTSHTENSSVELTPTERVALASALGRALRGDEPLPNTATVCVLALARITGTYDYTKAPVTDEKQSTKV